MKIKQKAISFRQCHLVVNQFSKIKAISKRKRYISAGLDLNQTHDQNKLITPNSTHAIKATTKVRRK